MIHQKKKIISELEEVLKSNNILLDDIWLFGSQTDAVSDVDIIIVYKKLKKIIFSKFIKNLLKGGTIIYIPCKNKKKIFLFEDLKIFSIKKKRMVKDSLDQRFHKYRTLSSFLERYYYARTLFDKVGTKINENNFIDLKSVMFSYDNFKKLNKYFKIKKSTFDYSRTEYDNIRQQFLKNKNKKKIKRYFLKMKKRDKKFFLESIKILNNSFSYGKIKPFLFNFNDKKFYYTNEKKNNVPNIYGQVYNLYATRKKEISKKILSDFKPKSKIYKLNKTFKKYLLLKLQFLNDNYLDLRKKKFKSGLYRFKWYL